MRDGCPNCEPFLNLRGNSESIQECTSQVFEGLIALANERISWVARWQRLDGYVPGTYALKVVGTVRDYATHSPRLGLMRAKGYNVALLTRCCIVTTRNSCNA